MQIRLQDFGKRYHYEWIFRHLDFTFESGKSYAILGPNGSGKSTLLNHLSGYLIPTEGQIRHELNGQQIPIEQLFRHLAYASPYLELVEEFTLQETLAFHLRFKRLRGNLTAAQLLDRLQLQRAKDKEVRHFSSGMKQRLKLGLALYTEAPLLLLDEPTTNLDAQGSAWYLEHVTANLAGRLTVISSNLPAEYSFCSETVDIMGYKS